MRRRLSTAEKFWPKVERRGPAECWPWIGARNELGYGMFWHDNRTDRAHRVSLMLAGIEVPNRWTTGLVVDHICKNRGCVNPAHLRIVPHRDNSTVNSDSPMARNARRTHCAKCGNPLSGDNIVRVATPGWTGRGRKDRVGKTTSRKCLTCNPRLREQSRKGSL